MTWMLLPAQLLHGGNFLLTFRHQYQIHYIMTVVLPPHTHTHTRYHFH